MKTQSKTKQGNPTIAKNIGLGTENKPNKNNHKGIIGRISRRFDMRIE